MPTSARRPLSALILTAALAAPLAAQGQSVRRFGEGTPGTEDIVPTLWVKSVPRPGDAAFRLRIERALGGTWAILFTGGAPANLTFGGVRFLIDTTATIYLGAYFLPGSGGGQGAGDLPLALPSNPDLVNAIAYVQAFTLDDFAPNLLGFGATAGLILRPAQPPVLLVARSTTGAPDPQTAIDLTTGATVDFDTAQFAEGSSIAFARHGNAALALDPTTGRLRAFDCENFPPTWTGNSALLDDGYPEQVTLTPDGSRAYVVHVGGAGQSPPIVAYDARAGAGFGQPWSGQPIRLELVPDARRIAFNPESTVAYVASLGLASGGGELHRVDVNPSSPSFHQATGRIDFPGQLATDVAISSDGKRAYVTLVAVTAATEIAVLDLVTWQRVDMDAQAPGVQNLGGEVSRPRTQLPLVLGRVVADPRGAELYCATVGGVVRVNAEPLSPNFRRVTLLNANIGAEQVVNVLALDDAGTRLYAATDAQIVEFDTATLASSRAWPIAGTVGLSVR